MLLTSQYVRIEQTAASVGDRMLAQLIDWGVMLAYITLVTWLITALNLDTFWVVVIFMLMPMCFYTLACEVFNHGQSLGKMAMKMRVVKVDGSTPTLGAFVMRWLLYLVDGPITSFMGVLVMVLTRSNQRLGDLAAGTMVVKLQNYKKIQVSLDEYDYLMKNYTPRYPQASDLSLEQIDTIAQALRAGASRLQEGDQTLARLANKVEEKLGVKRTEQTNEAFLSRVVRDYQYYALEEV